MSLREADYERRRMELLERPKGTRRRSGGERFEPLNALVHGGWLAELPGGEARVWIVLYALAGPDRRTRIGGAALGRKAGVNRTNALRHAAELARRGLVRVVERGHSGRGERRTANTYELLVPAPRAAPEEEGEEPD
jgi:hypothetical protein